MAVSSVLVIAYRPYWNILLQATITLTEGDSPSSPNKLITTTQLRNKMRVMEIETINHGQSEWICNDRLICIRAVWFSMDKKVFVKNWLRKALIKMLDTLLIVLSERPDSFAANRFNSLSQRLSLTFLYKLWKLSFRGHLSDSPACNQ